MDLQLTASEQAIQQEFEAFFAEHWDSAQSLMPGPRLSAATRLLSQALAARGWIAGDWPVALGGGGWSPRVRLLWERAAATAGAPGFAGHGVNELGPLLMRLGTAEQRSSHLPRIAAGDGVYCAALGEDSGTLDLAQVKTWAAGSKTAGMRLTGQKPWVLDVPPPDADQPCWLSVLARTEVEGTSGFSLFLLDAHSKGVRLEPRPMVGEPPGQHAVHSVTFESVLLDETALLGDPGRGAEYALELEQAALMRPGMVARNSALLGGLRRYAESPDSQGGGLWGDQDFRSRLHELEIETEALAALEARVWSEDSTRHPKELALRLGLAQRTGLLNEKLAQLQVDALGYFAQPFVDFSAVDNEGPIGPEFAQPALLGMLSGRARAAIGAPPEHLKNIIAKSAFNLPSADEMNSDSEKNKEKSKEKN